MLHKLGKNIAQAQEAFGHLLGEQLSRIEKMKENNAPIDFTLLPHITIGIIGGDGIGPYITKSARDVLKYLLHDAIYDGRIKLKDIIGLTIEHRSALQEAVPEEILSQIKKCHVILKGPTTTPQYGDKWRNVESANLVIRRELDLFANVRPVCVLDKGIDWTFFRENTEGAYALGSNGRHVTDDLAVDFTITTTQGSERILRAAFDYAKKNGKSRVTVVTKANVIKTTDGKFLDIARKISKEYPDIELDEWLTDIFAAKLIDPKRRTQFQVIVLPNLYGDIITDEAAELQGGVGTAGSANLGTQYAMFEAIHGSAPRMVNEGRTQYADPVSVMRAAAMMLAHIGFTKESDLFTRALDICTVYEKKFVITGRNTGCTCDEFTAYVMETSEKLLNNV
jgi:isocitrate dehydrogenase (NAD+)